MALQTNGYKTKEDRFQVLFFLTAGTQHRPQRERSYGPVGTLVLLTLVSRAFYPLGFPLPPPPQKMPGSPAVLFRCFRFWHFRCLPHSRYFKFPVFIAIQQGTDLTTIPFILINLIDQMTIAQEKVSQPKDVYRYNNISSNFSKLFLKLIRIFFVILARSTLTLIKNPNHAEIYQFSFYTA